MPQLIKNINFGNLYSGGIQRDSRNRVMGGSIVFPVEEALTLLETFITQKEDILANDYGLYSLSDNIVGDTAYWAGLDTTRWITTSQPDDCERTAKKRHGVTKGSQTMCPAHIFMTFCKREIVANFDSAWKSVWGAGNDLNEILSTPAGIDLFRKFITKVISARGNDFTSIAWFGNHSIIGDAIGQNENELTQDELDDATDTFGVCTGWLKRVDDLKNGSHPHLNNSFEEADIDGHTFKGDALGYIRSLDDIVDSSFDEAMDSLISDFNYPIVQCNKGFFRRLREQLVDRYVTLAPMLNYAINGTYNTDVTAEVQRLASRNTLVWDGKLIVQRPDWDETAKALGFYHHRVLMTVPMNLGLAIDVANTGTMFSDAGLIVTKNGDPEKGGRYNLESNYKMATNIYKDKLMANISITALPA